jgi:hypothetical protein
MDALRAFEVQLASLLGSDGRMVAVETSAGVRTMHFYTNSGTSATSMLKQAVQAWDDGQVEVSSALDPAWDAVRKYRQ